MSGAVLDHRAPGSAPSRSGLARIAAEIRQDLAYRPRPWRRDPARRAAHLRRTVQVIAVLLGSVVVADVVLLAGWHGPDGRRAAVGERPWAALQRNAAGSGDAAAERREPVPERTAGESARPSDQPTGGSPVAPLQRLHAPHVLVVAERPLGAEVVAAVRGTPGVAAAEVADAAEIRVDGKRVPTMGVDPSTFRSFTPEVTARSDTLWQNIADGAMAVSFDLGRDGGVALGSTVAAGGLRLRVGAYATVGMGSIAAIVSRRTARELGMPEGNALVVSAPKTDSARLRARLRKILPKGTQVVVINPVVVPPKGRTAWPESAFLTAEQVQTVLRAAASKLGSPYVWGAEGPDGFDCSGLVQWAYRQAGVRMPRVAAQQWATGPRIPLAEARPGDLLFWRNDPTNPGYISHVAIYWGNGMMLHAPRRGDVVKISKIYLRNFAGAVRVSPQAAARVG